MSSHWASRSAVAGIGSAMMGLMNPGPQRYERIDLHTHSTWSDGALSPAELVALAATPTRAHLAQLRVAHGHATDVDDAFKVWLARGRRAAVSAHWPALDATVAIIVAAGGLAVLAHPHRYRTSAGALRELCAEF